MQRKSVWALAPYLWTFLPMYGAERLANYYFLAGSPAFYLLSGWRMEVFILAALVGSVAAGAFLRDLALASATEFASIASLLAATYVLCDPRVCYSAGPDGFEPLRLGMFLGAVAAAGAAIGTGALGVRGGSWRRELLVGTAGVFAVGYYPAIFTFAGARLLRPLDPWATGALFFILALGTSMSARERAGRRTSFAAPVFGLLLLLGASAGISGAYLAALGPVVLLMASAVVAGALVGSSRPGGPAGR